MLTAKEAREKIQENIGKSYDKALEKFQHTIECLVNEKVKRNWYFCEWFPNEDERKTLVFVSDTLIRWLEDLGYEVHYDSNGSKRFLICW